MFVSGIAAIQAVVLTVRNNCSNTIWPATLTGAGQKQLDDTGFELHPGSSKTLNVPSQWSGRVWARTHCTTDASGRFQCETGDCASGNLQCNGAGGIPPASLAEMTLTGYQGQDFYDISLVDGFNLPVSMGPYGGSGNCTVVNCQGNVNSICPPELSLTGPDGIVVGCRSACDALGSPEYCCSGAYASPSTCPPTAYSLMFKQQCSQAYSYAYDDSTSTFTCRGSSHYLITFCP